jgi:hypothetical protein
MYPKLSKILYSAYFLRLFFALTNVFLTKLPDASNDAAYFEIRAWQHSLNGIEYVISQFPGLLDSYFYSWLISLFYALTDRSILTIHMVSVMFSVLSAVLVWKITIKLWDLRSAKIATWIFALYPTLILYGSLTLREPFFVFFILCGVWFIIKNHSQYSKFCLVKSAISFLFASMFHPVGLIILVFLLLYIIYSTECNKNNNFNLVNNEYGLIIRLSIMVLLLALFIYFLFFTTLTEIKIPKFGKLTLVFDFEHWKNLLFHKFVVSDAQYPSFFQTKDTFQFIATLPLRVIYFLFGPFPWDISKKIHLFGFFDAIFYIFLIFRMYSLRNLFDNKNGAIFLFLIILLLIIMFSLFTTNFGTSIRHRAKLLPLILILLAPKLKIFSLRK